MKLGVEEIHFLQFYLLTLSHKRFRAYVQIEGREGIIDPFSFQKEMSRQIWMPTPC